MRIRVRPPREIRARRLFRVDRSFRARPPRVSRRVRAVAEAFGIGLDESQLFTVFREFEIDVEPGQLVLVLGESGAGKSVLLRALAGEMAGLEEFRPVAEASRIRARRGVPIVDTLGRDFSEALEKLSLAGLNEAYLFLRSYEELSEGQKYRYRLARLMDSGAKTWVVDEFTSILDRTTARVVAYCLQRAARRVGATVLAATTHGDVEEDLNPDVVVRKGIGPQVSVEYRRPVRRECSLLREAVIEPGSVRDYEALKHFHYLGPMPPFRRAIYRARVGEDLAGVIVYTAPHAYLSARFRAFPFLREMLRSGAKGYLEFVTKNFSRIARVIVHPKYRSIGLGVRLVRETMPTVGTTYVETLAVMARYNPFFERAGMTRIDAPPPRDRFLEAAEALGVRIARGSLTTVLERLRRLPRSRLERLRGLCVRWLEGLREARLKSRADLLERLRRRLDLEALARALSSGPLPTVYLVWRRPDADWAPPPASEAYHAAGEPRDR